MYIWQCMSRYTQNSAHPQRYFQTASICTRCLTRENCDTNLVDSSCFSLQGSHSTRGSALSAAELCESKLQPNLLHLMQQLSCRLWPTAVKLSPAQLQPVAVSTVRCFIDQGYAVFWVPGVTSAYGGGEWVKASQACFLPIDDEAATPLVADVARRAALKIPHLPKHALEVHLQRF